MDGRTLTVVVVIAAGGGLGAVARHFVNTGVGMVLGTAFPWGILIINITGSFLIGVFAESFALAWDADRLTRLFLTTGICGGYTTFSAFSLDVAVLSGRGQTITAIGYVVASVLLSIMALYGGLFTVRALATVPQHIEEHATLPADHNDARYQKHGTEKPRKVSEVR